MSTIHRYKDATTPDPRTGQSSPIWNDQELVQVREETKKAVLKLISKDSLAYDPDFETWLFSLRRPRGKKGLTRQQLLVFGYSYWALTKVDGLSELDALKELSKHYAHVELEKLRTRANRLPEIKRLRSAKLTSSPKRRLK